MKRPYFISFSFILLVLFGCANPQPPSGGPPDETAPEIVRTEPLSGAINFDGDAVAVEFNKYMDKNSVNENIFISPSVKVEYDWSGKGLDIEFEEPLDSNTTYAITFGTGYTDYYEKNPPARAYSIIFSTGSVIDSGKIRGKLYDEEPSEIYIFAFRIDNIDPDTLDITHTPPRYFTQVGTSGEFEINALKDGLYRVFAVRDKFKNRVVDFGIDGFASAHRDFEVRNATSEFVNLRIGPPVDVTGPMIYGAEAVSENRIIASFSEDLDIESIKSNSFILTDSAETRQVDINAAFTDGESLKKVNIIAASAPDTIAKWMIRCSTDSVYAVRDTVGNMIEDTVITAYFFASTEKDTLINRLLSASLQDSSIGAKRDFTAEFIFSAPLEVNQDSIKFVSLSDSTDVEFEIDLFAQNRIEIHAASRLANDSWYRLILPKAALGGALEYPLADTSYEYDFKTRDTRDYVSVKGTFETLEKSPEKIVLRLVKKGTNFYLQKILSGAGGWIINDVPPGEYVIEVFFDSNDNGFYDFGNPLPYRYSEMFISLPQKINVRPRWDVEDVKIILSDLLHGKKE